MVNENIWDKQRTSSLNIMEKEAEGAKKKKKKGAPANFHV